MGNEMAQALLESSKDTETAKSTQNNEQINNKMAFQSITDLIWCENSVLLFLPIRLNLVSNKNDSKYLIELLIFLSVFLFLFSAHFRLHFAFY